MANFNEVRHNAFLSNSLLGLFKWKPGFYYKDQIKTKGKKNMG